MKQLDDMLKDNTTEHNIEEDLKMVCKFVPGTIRKDCYNFISEYSRSIIDTLDHLPPSEVCSAILLCAGKPKTKDVRVKGALKCEVCKDVMKLMKEILLDERIDKNLADDLEKLCGYLPKGISKRHRNQCYDVMEHYGPYIVNMLASLGNPGELCSYIDMCEATPGFVMIDPSVENCSLGPKYFCAKKKRARACKQTDFCKTIWGKKGEKKSKTKK
jgi:uncharacterized protein YbgA (DUF1722 family)